MLITLFIFLTFACQIQPIMINISSSGVFDGCRDELTQNTNNSIEWCYYNDSYVEWGTPTIDSLRSALEFVGNKTTFDILERFNQSNVIGNLIHYNYPITGNIPNYVYLKW